MSRPAGTIGQCSERGATTGTILGAGLADQLLKTMRSEGNYTTLNFVIRDMIAGGTFGGVEVGFLSEIAREIAKHDIMAKRLTARGSSQFDNAAMN
jgi:hypothetical protein